MKNKNIFFFFSSLFVFFSCNQGDKQNDAVRYANWIDFSKLIISGPVIGDSLSTLSKLIKSGKYDSLVIIGGEMEKKTDSLLSDVSSLPALDVKEGVQYKNAAIAYFRSFKSFYASCKDYGKANDAASKKAALQELLEKINERNDAIDTLAAERIRFMKENDLF